MVTLFVLGVAATVGFGFAGAGGIFSPEALFMGAIMTAISVGVTARALADLGRLDSAEGVPIIAAAVVDDVLGILIQTVVVDVTILMTVITTALSPLFLIPLFRRREGSCADRQGRPRPGTTGHPAISPIPG